MNAWAECDVIRGKLLQQMQEFPILLCPVCSIPAFRHGERTWKVEGQEVKYLDVMRYTQWFNLLAAPAAVVPVGRSPEGLPIGVQIVARPFEDEIALAVASVLDREFGFVPPPIARMRRAGNLDRHLSRERNATSFEGARLQPRRYEGYRVGL